MTTSTLWTTVKDELRERRMRREALATLRRDLEHYRTPAEIDDLLASVDAEEGPEAEMIRSILTDNLLAYHSGRPISA
jgi:hypothetical protein